MTCDVDAHPRQVSFTWVFNNSVDTTDIAKAHITDNYTQSTVSLPVCYMFYSFIYFLSVGWLISRICVYLYAHGSKIILECISVPMVYNHTCNHIYMSESISRRLFMSVYVCI